jgi:hypothetical protein
VVIGLAWLGGCVAETTFVRTEGAVAVTSEVGRPGFEVSGMQVNVAMACRAPVEERWCPTSEPHCQAAPVVATTESVACPKDVALGTLSLHTPWGQTYVGILVDDVFHVDINWRDVKGDLLADPNLAALRSNWLVQATDGKPRINYRMDLLDNELRDLLAVIAKATGRDYREAPAGERAQLTVSVTSQPVANQRVHVVVMVTNRGPSSAYRVVAQLGGVPGLKPTKLPLGRIEVGGTEKTGAEVPLAGASNASDPQLTVDVTASNAPAVSAKHGLPVKPKSDLLPPQLACSSSATQAAPGQQIPIECLLDNPNDGPLRGVTYRISTGPTDPTPPVQVGRIEPHEQHKLAGEVTVPAGATSDAPLMVAVTIGDPVIAQQEISIPIVQPHKLCNQGQLTVADYERKRKRLDEERIAGRISQAKFNDYLAELWSCVRQSPAHLQPAPPP